MSDPYIGQIILVGFNFAPQGYAFCDGQLLAIAQNDTLFNLIGTTYGGDGQTTFALPDLRGRIPIGTGQAPSLSNYIIGEAAGTETVTLIPSQLATHTHLIDTTSFGAAAKCYTGPGNQQSPEGNVYATEAAGATMPYSSLPANSPMNENPAAIGGVITVAPAGGTVAPAGGTAAHDNMQPFLTMNFCISLFGFFPSQS
jgi:microcystin-dependent protein